MKIDNSIHHPITVTFENGEIEAFEDKEDLEMNLEVFDSDLEPDCAIHDAVGRRVRLKISDDLRLEILELL